MANQPRKKAEDALLLALACGATVEQAARQCRLSARTVYRRLADADFRRRLQALRADMVQRTAGMLTAASGEGVKTLLALLKEATPPATRLGAARAVLELGVKFRETVELEERLAALEAAEAQRTEGRRR
jgi:Homeodomain-like domain